MMQSREMTQSKDMMQAKINVLIVDDSPMVVQLVNDVLEPHGYSCTRAYNSLEAQTRLQQQPFDLLLTDVNMPPGDSGLALMQHVVKYFPETATIISAPI